ncbi:hypothetical protein [Actinomadura sp. 3N407]|uniref:hypothetical protein n=1 Tax=Actinomadura sp. 3N407 TaxID=3457423 RepID=UPI003FCD23B1
MSRTRSWTVQLDPVGRTVSSDQADSGTSSRDRASLSASGLMPAPPGLPTPACSSTYRSRDPATPSGSASPTPTMFIGGLPTNSATNRLPGRSYISIGGATCCSSPSDMTAMCVAIVMASI